MADCRAPHKLYVLFLATTGIDCFNEVNSILAEKNLPKIKQGDLDEAWDLIFKVVPKTVQEQLDRKTYCADFLRYMKILDVEELWFTQKAFSKHPAKISDKILNGIFEIVDRPELKTCINALILNKMSVTEIARILSGKFSMNILEGSVELYAKYFFNASHMRRSDWKGFLASSCGAEEQKLYFMALTESADVLKTELGLPAVISVSDSLQWLLAKSFQKAKTFMNQNSIEANKEARAWTNQVIEIADKYEKYRSGDQADFAKSLQMEFTFVEEEFDSPDDDLVKEVKDKNAAEKETPA